MAARSVSPKPATTSPPHIEAVSIELGQAFADPLADVPLLSPVTDRFEIQPGDITLITVGSIEVVTHPSNSEDGINLTTPPTGRPSKRRRSD